jgi:hypothetical protein
MVNSPHHSSSAPYPSGSEVFLQRAEETGVQDTALLDIAKEDNILPPPRTVGKYRAILDANIAAYGLPLSGTPVIYSPLFDDDSHALSNSPKPGSARMSTIIGSTVRNLSQSYADAMSTTLTTVQGTSKPRTMGALPLNPYTRICTMQVDEGGFPGNSKWHGMGMNRIWMRATRKMMTRMTHLQMRQRNWWRL